jgi:hypothetical protein
VTGDFLARVMRRFLHEDTFELIVSPAIADLQHTPTRTAYLAVWSSFLGALGNDVSGDVGYVLEDLGLMIGLVAMQTCYYCGMLLVLVANVPADQMLGRLANGAGPLVAAAVIGVILASSIPTLLCFWPPRRTLHA